MIARITYLAAILGPLLYTGQVPAVEALRVDELVEHCQAFPADTDSPDGQFCIRYIQGFIDGAVATDQRVMLNVEAAIKREESFSERATRLRLPGGASRLRDRAAVFAEYCLGDPVPLPLVVGKIVAELNDKSNGAGDSLAREAVYSALREHYPCKELEKK